MMRILPKIKIALCFLAGFTLGASLVRFTPPLVEAADFLFGTDPSTGEFTVKEVGGNVKMRIDSTGALSVPLKNSPSSTDLIINGGFENDVAQASNPAPDNWIVNFHFKGSGYTPSYQSTATNVREGVRSLQVTLGSTADGTSFASNPPFPIIPGKTYTASVDAMDTGGGLTGGFYMKIFLFSSDATISNPGNSSATIPPSGYLAIDLSPSVSNANTTGTWATYSGDFTVPSQMTYCGTTDKPCTRGRLVIYHWGVAGTRYFDNAKVTVQGAAGTVPATNVSSGTFGSGTGWGNYTFGDATNQSNLIVLNGNVGIGTNTPAAKLDIIGTSKISNTSGNIDIVPALNFVISTGNVGIGTSTPTTKLDVVGAYGSKIVQNGNTGTAKTIDWSTGLNQHVIHNGNVTYTFNNGVSGRRYTLIIKHDATATSFTTTWPATVRWSGGTAPSITQAANITTYVGFIYNDIDSKYDGVASINNF